MLEKILERHLSFTQGCTRSLNAFQDAFQSLTVPHPHRYQLNLHSKIFGSIPVGTTRLMPVTDELQKILTPFFAMNMKYRRSPLVSLGWRSRSCRTNCGQSPRTYCNPETILAQGDNLRCSPINFINFSKKSF